MVNPKHISQLVKKTLKAMNVQEPAIERLIKGTFVIESGLSDLFDYSNPYRSQHGFMLLEYDVAEAIIKEYIRFKPPLADAVFDATGFDVRQEDVKVLINELDSNIRFMIAVLYAFYQREGIDIRDDDIKSIGKIYDKYYNVHDDVSWEDFVEQYNESFVN